MGSAPRALTESTLFPSCLSRTKLGIVCPQGESCWEPEQSKLNTTQMYTGSEVRSSLTRGCRASPELGKIAFGSQVL